MLNQVKENKSEKKFKGEVLGINDKLQIICWLFILLLLLGVYLLGIMIITPPNTKQTVKQVGVKISLLEYI